MYKRIGINCVGRVYNLKFKLPEESAALGAVSNSPWISMSLERQISQVKSEYYVAMKEVVKQNEDVFGRDAVLQLSKTAVAFEAFQPKPGDLLPYYVPAAG